ncbi:autophagy protein Apg9-domain-containing protein [Syncephalis fuscata]|nr:autophagy protein Apg9-domain-containing protein [Syncephalis fuscata]
MGDPLSATGSGDTPYYAFVDDYPFRAAYRQQHQQQQQQQSHWPATGATNSVHGHRGVEAPASLMVEMNPLGDDDDHNGNNGVSTDRNDYNDGTNRQRNSNGRRLRFGDQRYERVASSSHEDPSFFGHGIRHGGGLGNGLRNWRSRVSSRERAIYEWTNVDNLDTFFARVYAYYQGKGVYCILLNRLLSLLMLAFVIIFTTFLVGCINYGKLRTSKSLSDAVYDNCNSHMSGWLKFFVVAAWFYWSWKLLVFVYDVRKLVEMYNFYTFLLEIPDCDMQTVDWNLVVSRIIKLRETTPTILNAHPSLRINAHDICNRILRKENYMIALINKDLLDLTVPAPLRYIPMLGGPVLTRTVEWNLQLCLINYAFDENGQVKKAFLRDSQRHVLVEGLRRRFITMGFINFICAPFIFVYLLLMLFFRYFAEYHKYPSAIGSRQYTRFARWKFHANRYVDQFPRQSTAHLARFVSFIAGSFALVLFLLTIIDQELLLNFYITSDRSVAFYLGLFGTVFAIARGAIPDENIVFEPEATLRAVVAETHYLPGEWRNRLHTDEVRRQFCELFDLKPANCRLFREFTVHVDGVGYVCSFALFDFKRHGNVRYGAPSEAVNEHFISKEGKMEKSFINFKANNPDWEPEDMAGSLYLTRLQGDTTPSGQRQQRPLRSAMSQRGQSTRTANTPGDNIPIGSPQTRIHPLMHQRTFSTESINDSMLKDSVTMDNEAAQTATTSYSPTSHQHNNISNDNSLYDRGSATNTLPPLKRSSRQFDEFNSRSEDRLNENNGIHQDIESTLADLSNMHTTMLPTTQSPYLTNDNDGASEMTASVSGQVEGSSTASYSSNRPLTQMVTSPSLSSSTHQLDESENEDNDDDDDMMDGENRSTDGNVFALMNEFYDDRLPTL